MITVYTDGSAYQGKGGWCALLEDGNQRKLLYGKSVDTTNNRMELQAIMEGIAATKPNSQVLVVTDSKDCIGWLCGWSVQSNMPDATKPWKRKDPVIARTCAMIDPLIARRKVEFQHVRGHQGHPQNELCDKIAGALRIGDFNALGGLVVEATKDYLELR